MGLLLGAIVLLVVSGVLALAASRFPRLSTILGAGGAVAGCALGLVPAVRTVVSGTTETMARAWDVPYGSFTIGLSPLSAWFLLAILGLSGLSAIYGAQYLDAYRERKRLGVPWFFYNVLVASMALVVVARNGVLFLVAWEVMSLASYFLVTFEDEEAQRARGGPDLSDRHSPRDRLLAGVLRSAGSPGGLAGLHGDCVRRATATGAGQPAFRTGRDRLRDQGRVHSAARVAPGGASGRAEPRLGGHVRGDGQDRDLRPGSSLDVPPDTSRVVGMAPGRDRHRLRDLGGLVRHRAARLEAPSGVPHRREHRHHRARAGARVARREFRRPDPGRAGNHRGVAARGQSCVVQGPAFPGRGGGRPCDGHAGRGSRWAASRSACR